MAAPRGALRRVLDMIPFLSKANPRDAGPATSSVAPDRCPVTGSALPEQLTPPLRILHAMKKTAELSLLGLVCALAFGCASSAPKSPASEPAAAPSAPVSTP